MPSTISLIVKTIKAILSRCQNHLIFKQVGLAAKQLSSRMPSSVIFGCKSSVGSNTTEVSNKKIGAKSEVGKSGEVVYEVELDDGKVKKVAVHDAVKEIYKYMHGKTRVNLMRVAQKLTADKVESSGLSLSKRD